MNLPGYPLYRNAKKPEPRMALVILISISLSGDLSLFNFVLDDVSMLLDRLYGRGRMKAVMEGRLL